MNAWPIGPKAQDIFMLAYPHYRQLIDYLNTLPGSASHPVGLPSGLAKHLTPCRRPPRVPDPTTLPQAWVEYRLLALLARTGWSLRWALVEFEADYRAIAADSGTFKRSCRQLASQGLWQTTVVPLPRRTAFVELTEQGRQLLESLGLTVVESEWARLGRLHRGGGDQARHTAAVCAFAYHARKRGYETVVCPPVADKTAEPDLLLQQGNNTIYVEVQGRGGNPWQRAAKWRNLARLQGSVALCALTPMAARRLVGEIRRCGLRRVVATDLLTLQRENPGDLWTFKVGMT